MRKALMLVLLVLLVSSQSVLAQPDTLRISTYNLLNFPGEDRVPYFQTVTDGFSPDLIVCQEIFSETGAELFLQDVLGTAEWNRSYETGIGYSEEYLYYKSALFNLLDVISIETDLRNVELYELEYLGDPTSPTLYIANAHLKASQGSTNEQRRLIEVNDFLDYMQANNLEGENVFFAGDFNLYDSDEPAYQAMISDPIFMDPLDAPGNWHDNSQFSWLHTQSTRLDQFGGGSSGGMDDRFDFILATPSLFDGQGWEVLDGSYTAYGNDGQHFNQSINSGTNQAVPADIADALHFGTDHLPVYLDLLSPTQTATLTITLTPVNPPIQIPPGGDWFTYDAFIENVSGDAIQFDAWTEAILPNGNVYGPIFLREGLQLGAGGTLNPTLMQNVPSFAPAGDYTYVAKVGNYPGTVIDSDDFPFVKLATGAGAEFIMDWGISGWNGNELSAANTGTAESLPAEYSLISTWPNPFNSSLTVGVTLPEAARLSVEVYDIQGRLVAMLADGALSAGTHHFTFNATGFSSGIYFVRAASPGQPLLTRKVVLVR